MDPLERFEFSQSSLQDFVECRKRFQLRYIQRLAWPAVQAEPARENERHIQRGERFHRLAQQFLVGVPEPALNRMAEADEDENLQRWWSNFLECIPKTLRGTRFVEIALAAPVGRFRLVAKYDLVLLTEDGKVLIYDWKTGTKRPARSRLLERLQTRVYSYLMVQAGAALNQGRAIQPHEVEMVYWFAEPDQPEERFQYDPARYAEDDQYLKSLLAQIGGLPQEEYLMAESEKSCPYCIYRSLCRRGVQAGDINASADNENDPGETLFDIDLEQIAEISF